MLRCSLPLQEERITAKIAPGSGGGSKETMVHPRLQQKNGWTPRSLLKSFHRLSPSIGFFPEYRIWHSLDLFPLLLPSLFSFYGPGGEGEREEIGIFLIKMQFYKYLFYLMLQELNIIFLLLDLRRAAYWLAGRGKGRHRKGKYFHLQIKELLREETKIRKCKPPNCIPISNCPLQSRKWGTTCVWVSGASDVRNIAPISLDCIFQRQRWEMSPFCLQSKIYIIMASIFTLRNSWRWALKTGNAAILGVPSGPGGAAFREPPEV